MPSGGASLGDRCRSRDVRSLGATKGARRISTPVSVDTPRGPAPPSPVQSITIRPGSASTLMQDDHTEAAPLVPQGAPPTSQGPTSAVGTRYSWVRTDRSFMALSLSWLSPSGRLHSARAGSRGRPDPTPASIVGWGDPPAPLQHLERAS